MGCCCTKYYLHKKEGTIPNVLGVFEEVWEEEYFLYTEQSLNENKIDKYNII